MTPAGRALGVDLGSRRIGIAVSDAGGVLASPYHVLERAADLEADHGALARLVDEVGATVVVVGLPLSLSGGRGPAADAVLAEVAVLRRRLRVRVEVVDERLSTVVAGRALHAAGVGSRQRRRIVDQAAAAVILQSWLDSGAAR